MALNHVMAGGTGRAGTASGEQLLIPVGARGLAMGGATVAFTEGVESIFWNPAGLTVLLTGSEAIFSHMPHIADISVNYGAAGVNLGSLGQIAFSIKVMNMGEIDVTTVDLPDGTGESFTPTFFTTGLTYARKLTDRVSIGGTWKFINEQFPRVSASTWALDAGVQYQGIAGINPLSIGMVIKHFGPAMRYDGPGLYREVQDNQSNKESTHYKISTAAFDLPSCIDIGLAYKRSMGKSRQLILSYVFRNSHTSSDENKFGIEYGFNQQVFLRTGLTKALDASEEAESIYGPVFGVGCHFQRMGMHYWIDYAYRTVEFFDSSHVFSIILGF